MPSPRSTLAATTRTLFAAALADCSIARAFDGKFITAAANHPHAFTLRSDDQPSIEIDLTGIERILIIAAGKAATPMLDELLRRLPLPPACSIAGVLIAPQTPTHLPPGIEFFPGGHPLPTAESFAGARAALSLIEQAAATERTGPATRTFCFFLISGGASAMLELPLDAAISLDDTLAFHRALVHSGAPIAQINCVRKHFSAVKGGRLGRAAASIPNLTLLVSDVPPGHLDALGSGPTLPDPSTVAECRDILARYHLLERFPASARRFFLSPDLPETPKPGDFAARAFTLLSSNDLAEAARRHAESLGFTAIIDNTCDDWDYRAAADYLLDRLRTLHRQHRRTCLISSGEVTVPLPPDASAIGIGGRNQHFALYAATLLATTAGCAARPTTILSAGSDGIDGNSRFAGAVLDHDWLEYFSAPRDALLHLPTAPDLPTNLDDVRANLDAARLALLNFDASTLLDRLGSTIETGPTGNNLRDLRLLLSEQ